MDEEQILTLNKKKSDYSQMIKTTVALVIEKCTNPAAPLSLELATIRAAIPHNVIAATRKPPVADDSVVAITTEDSHQVTYARKKTTDGETKYTKLFLDLSQHAHDTGTQIEVGPQHHILPVEMWGKPPKQSDDAHNDETDADADPGPHDSWEAIRPRTQAIIGPYTTAFPRDIGWSLQGASAQTTKKGPDWLSDLTISRLTEHFTSHITRGARPSCIKAWKEKLGEDDINDYIYTVFRTIASSPIADATEEKQWNKLLQRATYVRNRDPKAPTNMCRLCNTCTESIAHLFQCRKTAPLWRECMHTCRMILGSPQPSDARRAIIFNVRQTGNGYVMLPELARSFIRHIYNSFYHDFSNVDIQGTHFRWQHTYYTACKSFYEALQRYAHGIRLLYIRRRYTGLSDTVPKEARDRYEKVLTIEMDGTHTIQPSLTAELDRAKARSDAIDKIIRENAAAQAYGSSGAR
jgi:hypothetical protein